MGRTSYKRQKAYRDRKKQEGTQFLENERQRSQQQREKQRQNKQEDQAPGEKRETKLKFKRETQQLRDRLNKATFEIQFWKQKYINCLKNLSRVKLAQQKKESERKTSNDDASPRKRMGDELRSEGISPSKSPRLAKKVLLANVLTEQMKNESQKGQKTRKVIRDMVSGKLINKYRLKSYISSNVTISRKSLSKKTTPRKKKQSFLLLQSNVVEFLQRDDNSRQNPGKNDQIKQEQTRTLNDSLKNLHAKFQSEHPNFKISFTTFCRMRPKHIHLTRFLTRKRCLCQKHQNMALCLKAARLNGIRVPQSPEDYAKVLQDKTPADVINELSNEEIKLSQWKKVSCKDGKKRMRVVDSNLSKEEFVSTFIKQSEDFLLHTQNIQQQYKSIADLKKMLPKNHVIVQMDFSENYSCSHSDEVQNAYFNPTMVTLHPVVFYYRNDAGGLDHKSLMFVSDDLGHNAGSVFAFITRLIPKIRETVPDVMWIHYWTDSPTSQYRNKSVFHIISDHEHLFHVPASWNFFEAGHGKGPCDGIGGVSKRMADQAVRQGRSIQDAKDFFLWGQQTSKSIMYLFVNEEEVVRERTNLERLTAEADPIKGTMSIHAVVPLKPATQNVVYSKSTSCYCNSCLSEDLTQCGWKREDFRKKLSRKGKKAT